MTQCSPNIAATVAVAWARRGHLFQVLLIGLIGGCGVALAALQPKLSEVSKSSFRKVEPMVNDLAAVQEKMEAAAKVLAEMRTRKAK